MFGNGVMCFQSNCLEDNHSEPWSRFGSDAGYTLTSKKALHASHHGLGTRMVRTKHQHMLFQLNLICYRYVPLRLAKDLNRQIGLPIVQNTIPTIEGMRGAVKANKLVRAGTVFANIVLRWSRCRL